MFELTVLSTLLFGSCYGYEIKKMLKGMNVNNNTIYPMFKKLVNNGHVTVEEIAQEGKPSKKVYTITESGKERLYELIEDFDENDASVDDAFYLRLAFFQFLPKETIKKILNAREAYLQDYENRMKLMSILSRFPDNSNDLLYLKNFSASKLFNEKQMVETMKKRYGIN